MPGAASGPLGPIALLLLVLATDAWVYADARAQARRGTPVVFSAGSLMLDSPAAWLLGSLVLWIVFFPLYVTGRSRTR